MVSQPASLFDDAEDQAAAVQLEEALPPRKVYDSAWATVWCGRAEDVLPFIGTESVDVVLTDPPYGMEHQSRRRAERFDRIAGDGADQASRDQIRHVLAECVRTVGQHRHLYVFGPADVLAGLKVAQTAELVWDKGSMGSGDVTAAWGPQHEPITFAVSKHRHAGEAGKGNLPARLRKGSVLPFQRIPGRKLRHPHQKPVPLARELLESSSRQGETMLDPYAGSGSFGVAAILCGRRCILIERDPVHAALAVERVQAAERFLAEMAAV